MTDLTIHKLAKSNIRVSMRNMIRHAPFPHIIAVEWKLFIEEHQKIHELWKISPEYKERYLKPVI